jgi:hypothetical protein
MNLLVNSPLTLGTSNRRLAAIIAKRQPAT